MADVKEESKRYPLLEFEYDKGPYEKTLELSNQPGFVSYTSGNPDNYMHEGFGFSRGDDKKVLEHAVYLLKKKKSKRATLSPSELRELCDDFRHYCYCVKYADGEKAVLQDLMEAVLFYGGDKVVYEEVIDWHKDTEERPAPSTESVFDFDKLYIKMGDRFLFLENNVFAAMKFYGLAALEWSTEPLDPILCGNAGEYAVDFDEEYETLIGLAQGNPYNESYSTTLLSHYNDLLKLEYPSQMPTTLSDFTDKVRGILNHNGKSPSFHQRIALITMIVLMRKYLVPEMAQLSEDDCSSLRQSEIIEKSRFLKGTDFDALAVSAQKIGTETLSYRDYLYLAQTAHLSNLILLELKAEGTEKKIAYYTSSEVFSYMLPVKCTGEKKDRLGKLTVMHLSYMNDPNEGQTLLQTVYGDQYDTGKKDRKSLNVPYVFVKCFTPRVDYLPMWEMYGDHAKGCCLIIDWETTKNLSCAVEPTLYHVCYLRKNAKNMVLRGDNEKLAQNYKEIERQLRQLRQITKRLNKANRPYFDSLLGKVLYLFKDSSYSYEQELRVIYQTKDNILHTDSDKPWLFVQTPFPLQLDEVILGPKFPDVSTRVPYLQEQLDLMCEKTGTEKPRITLSEIDYR